MSKSCLLCRDAGGTVLLRTEAWRIVLALDEPLYPGLCRVIWNAHVRELTDLEPTACAELLQALVRTERALRQVLKPVKVNLASLGNVTPHLHWHVVPRREDDAHFPNAIWGPERRKAMPPPLAAETIAALKTALEQRT